MQFIIMDLEWNNAYCKKLKGYINEIIEFGACKVDKDFNVIDEFSVIVKAQVGKKLQGRVKALTHITNEDISNGVPFFKALSMFRNWVGDDENVFFSWGDGDIRTLIKNYEFFLKKKPGFRLYNNYCDSTKIIVSLLYPRLRLRNKSGFLPLLSSLELIRMNFRITGHLMTACLLQLV